jgi:hypothetical protein
MSFMAGDQLASKNGINIAIILGLGARCALRSALALALISASARFLESLSASASATLAERMR